MLPVLSRTPLKVKLLQLTSQKEATILKYFLQPVLSVVKELALGIASVKRGLRMTMMCGDENIGIVANVTVYGNCVYHSFIG